MSRIGEFVLSRLSRNPNTPDYTCEHYEHKHRDISPAVEQFDRIFPDFRSQVACKKVLDIGCAEGIESIALGVLGAREVIGIDIRIDLERARQLKAELAPATAVNFYRLDAGRTPFGESEFDVVVSLSSFEHFSNPLQILKECKRILKTGGLIYLTCGAWYNPYGAHMNFFTHVPWVHLLFSEKTIMKVRSRYRHDGARRFSEVEGGLNDITISRFRRYVRDVGMTIEHLALIPVKGMVFLTKIPLIKEFFTTEIVAILRK